MPDNPNIKYAVLTDLAHKLPFGNHGFFPVEGRPVDTADPLVDWLIRDGSLKLVDPPALSSPASEAAK